MRATILGLFTLLSSIARAEGANDIQTRILKIDSQLERKGVAVLCIQENRSTLEAETETLNAIIAGLKNSVEASMPAITSGGSYTYSSVCVTLTKK